MFYLKILWDEVDTLRIWYFVIFKVLCVSLDNVTQVTHHAWEKFLSLVNVDNLWKSSSSDVLRVYMQYNYLYDFYKVIVKRELTRRKFQRRSQKVLGSKEGVESMATSVKA